jgi:hypothetical protein
MHTESPLLSLKKTRVLLTSTVRASKHFKHIVNIVTKQLNNFSVRELFGKVLEIKYSIRLLPTTISNIYALNIAMCYITYIRWLTIY